MKNRAGSSSMRAIIVVAIIHMILSFGPCFAVADDNCSTIPLDEVNILRQVAREVGKPDWNCSTDPCINSQNETCWMSNVIPVWTYTNLVNCTCHNGTWHVSDIYWKRQNLTGVLPRSLSKLPHITHFDISGNVLTGTIPEEWATTKLDYLSLFANRLSGPIPKVLGNMTTLTILSLESNQFSGAVPSELGNLINLTQLVLSDNHLTGKLPAEFQNLINLQILYLNSNNFSGSLPDYFQNYPKLQYLQLIGSGFEGPIPSSISNLLMLKELRISDLPGEASGFPPLQNLTQLSSLVLRNCNISGDIPSYIGNTMLQLRNILDLSFNKLTGTVPYMSVLDNLFLASNMLNGPIPDWITASDRSHIDLSYNNFDSINDLVQGRLCSSDTVNLYRCDARQNSLYSSACLESLKCSKDRYSLHINCGGQEARIGKIKYEQDIEIHGASTFFHSKPEWGFSSSGEFSVNQDNYIAQNTSILRMNDAEAALFKEARIAASYLTYYGRCLAKGKYTVTLYFAEIVFSDDDTYIGRRRRLFDIYIQGNLYVKDFDIAAEAQGANKALKKTFPDISVDNFLEIRFYYDGKGSARLPVQGNSGPLISAISIESQFKPPFDWKIVMWVLLGVIACLFCVVLGNLLWKRRMAHIRSKERELQALNPQIGLFTYQQIKAACNNFSAANKIGQGGFGTVYKGTLLNGTHIAVKQLSAKSSQGNREFITEVGMVSSLYHPNLVRLYGCCVDTSQLILVYEYMENKDLGKALFGSEEGRSRLDWSTRTNICIGIARGLAFLHEESRVKIIHRDIKATNVLLGHDLNPKISDFGLARLNEEEYTHISTKVAGTVGYMAPEYALRGYLTPKADVYSFGVVILELMAGRSNMQLQPEDDHFCLLDWALVLKQKGDLMKLMDPILGTDYNTEEALTIIQVALLCTNTSPALRPTMSEVLNMLEGNTELPELILEPNSSYDLMFQASRNRLRQMSEVDTQSVASSFYAQSFDSSSKFFTRSESG